MVENLRVVREREVAFDSPDHLMPWGTRLDNSRNHRFNEKLYRLFPREKSLRILDMGCSGGGFVKDCIDDGCLAIGLEGSDYSLKYRRAEWRTIPEYLWTCDITRTFDIYLGPSRLMFDVVTCWELIEHLTEEGIDSVAENVKRHLSPCGLWIMSVSPNEDVVNGVRLHQTVQPKPWWLRKFESLGLVHHESIVSYFRTQFVRGPKYEGPGSFILALARKDAVIPQIPTERWRERIHDLWLGSKPQRLLRHWLIG